MAAVPPIHEEILGIAQARRDREGRRLADIRSKSLAASGACHPSAEDLLRGHPLQGGDIRLDIREFVARASQGLADHDTIESLMRLRKAAERTGPNSGANGKAILEALRQCHFSPEVDRDGCIRLRCVIYAALLGDVDAAQAVAAEAALAAYVQDWHLVGDGSELLWQAAAWSAFSAASVGSFRPLPYPISEMVSVRARIDAFAEEFRLKVVRLLPEVA